MIEENTLVLIDPPLPVYAASSRTVVARFLDPLIGTGYGAKTGECCLQPGSDIWQKNMRWRCNVVA